MENVAIVWYRNNLRLHDNETLVKAIAKADVIVPVFIIDKTLLATTKMGMRKMGAHRAKFLLEAVTDLAKSFEKYGVLLQVFVGDTIEILTNLAKQYQAKAVYAEGYSIYEEQNLQEAVETALWQQQVPIVWDEGNTLLHISDLPFPVTQLPNIFTEFRKACEREVSIRPIAATPKQIPSIPLPPTPIPSLLQLGYKPEELKESDLVGNRQFFIGGETAALAHLDKYLWQTHQIQTYKQTRNQLLGTTYSTRFSPWLALGCLSARQIWHQIKQYEHQVVSNESTYWVIFELYWRDYFSFVARKFGNALFLKGGIKNQPIANKIFKAGIERWKSGNTGNPFIDANMRELAATGFMSNRGRQNVASYFVKDLKQDWRIGAAYFEEQLLDYDVCSNWGNWNYVAGIGNDPREDRYFNTYKQATMYDPNAQFIKHWLPELTNLPPALAIKPHLLSKEEQNQYGLIMGINYPKPIVNVF